MADIFILQPIYFTAIFETEWNSLSLKHFFFLPKITRLLHRRAQAVEHQPIESVTVDNDAHFKTHDKTKLNQHAESQPPIEIVQCQMSTASAALAIQITSLLCFALGCGREKNLDNGFHLPPSQTNHTSIGSTHCSGWRIGNTATQHCRWHWSRSMLLHLPVFLCQCQFFFCFCHTTLRQESRGSWQICGSTWKNKQKNLTRTVSRQWVYIWKRLWMLTFANSSPGARCVNTAQMHHAYTISSRINSFIEVGCVVRMHALHAYLSPCTDQTDFWSKEESTSNWVCGYFAVCTDLNLDDAHHKPNLYEWMDGWISKTVVIKLFHYWAISIQFYTVPLLNFSFCLYAYSVFMGISTSIYDCESRNNIFFLCEYALFDYGQMV